ncbi:MAG: tRNA 5-methoxyuridine(34)/uridine 5-oxyacetic acid(34) synthase CmoB [Gammaproteobacteria bacterium]|jgi:tRNA (mo5U34)-methyltransferase
MLDAGLFRIDALAQALRRADMQRWAETLPRQIDAAIRERQHGDIPRWKAALDDLPRIEATQVDLDAAAVMASGDALTDTQIVNLKQTLLRLSPWRKGPYQLHGVTIDTEWRSDWKWNRIAPHIRPLRDRSVLDIGCGNGYHLWRMAGAGANPVLGIDPNWLFMHQFAAIRHFVGDQWPVWLLPLGVDELPPDQLAFDSVFSMGVFYHRRSPIDHLLQLKSFLKPGGELVLETLVIEGREGEVLLPADRYAQMRNVWFLPSPPTLVRWMERAGFRDVRLADLNRTSVEEQRSTEWMQFDSLPDFLDPDDRSQTLEGYPSPLRAVFIATL